MKKKNFKQNIKNNLDKILKGEIIITYVPSFRKHLIKSNKIEYKCECGINSWKGQSLILDLDHVDGNKNNNTKDNLRWLCPNCHSQTTTFRAKNISSYKKKSKSEVEILEEIKKGGNINQILKRLKLNNSGGNYYRIKNIIKKYNIFLDA